MPGARRAVLALAVVVAGCGAPEEARTPPGDPGTEAEAPQEPERGGTLVAGISADPGHLNPAVTTSGATHTASEILYNGLVGLDDDLDPVPELAEDWEISDGGATYTFRLREDVQWHDGEPSRPRTSAGRSRRRCCSTTRGRGRPCRARWSRSRRRTSTRSSSGSPTRTPRWPPGCTPRAATASGPTATSPRPAPSGGCTRRTRSPPSAREGLAHALDVLRHLALPALVLASQEIAAIARLTRSELREELHADYVRTAWAKGLPPRVVVTRHALRQALLPVVTDIGGRVGHLLSGAVVVANLLTDLAYAYLDPRIRYR